jgi:hypothetical protein
MRGIMTARTKALTILEPVAANVYKSNGEKKNQQLNQ